MSARTKDLIFPLTVLLAVVSYWLQLEGAPRAARVVPQGVLVLLLALVGAVALTALRREPPPGGAPAASWILGAARAGWRQIAIVGLSIGYYFAFELLGFHIANALFLACAFPIAGVGLRSTVLLTLGSVVVLYVTASLMQFNVPEGWLFR
ncbi:MAG TPA: hypothetical protein VF406_16975 [Thermodesulfobacteriota bacterium]